MDQIPQPTCGDCIHFRPPAAEGQPGHCYGVPPQIITIGTGKDAKTRRSQPETEANDLACPHHPGHAAWIQASTAAKRTDGGLVAPVGGRPLDAVQIIDTYSCSCVRLGARFMGPGRVKINIPGDTRTVSANGHCRHCRGTGMPAEPMLPGIRQAAQQLTDAQRQALIAQGESIEVEAPFPAVDGEQILGDNGQPLDGRDAYDPRADQFEQPVLGSR